MQRKVSYSYNTSYSCTFHLLPHHRLLIIGSNAAANFLLILELQVVTATLTRCHTTDHHTTRSNAWQISYSNNTSFYCSSYLLPHHRPSHNWEQCSGKFPSPTRTSGRYCNSHLLPHHRPSHNIINREQCSGKFPTPRARHIPATLTCCHTTVHCAIGSSRIKWLMQGMVACTRPFPRNPAATAAAAPEAATVPPWEFVVSNKVERSVLVCQRYFIFMVAATVPPWEFVVSNKDERSVLVCQRVFTFTVATAFYTEMDT